MQILQIVPRLPPDFCGVGDYARLLASAMRPMDVKTHFVIADPEWKGASTLDDCSIEVLSQRTSKAFYELLTRLDYQHVFLHYVGYGYDPYGCPQWLLEGLQNWKSENLQKHLTTMFHESYASGAVWTRAFWSSNHQKRIVTALAEMSDGCRTNMRFIARRLEKMAPRHQNQISVAPVFSTIGEPQRVTLLTARKPQMAIFGNALWRRQAYFEHRDQLISACKALQVERIIDIGKPFEGEVKFPLPLVQTNALPAEKVSEILSESQAGFLTYPERFLGKSTIFAAYCAHGLIPVCAGLIQDNEDDLVAGSHFCRAQTASFLNSQTVATKSHSWYGQHSLQTQAQQLANFYTFGKLPL